MIIPCFCILAMFAGAYAESGEVTCCPPDHLMHTRVKGKIVCYTSGSNNTSLAKFGCEFGFGDPYPYKNFVFKDDKVELVLDGDSFGDISDRYCLNDLYDSEKNITNKVGIVCYDPIEVPIVAYILIVSVVFLLLSAIIYSALSELRELLGLSFINLCGSLAIGFCLYAAILFNFYIDTQETDTYSCAVKGFLAYYFMLVSFFWTTAISIQLLLSIRNPSLVNLRCWKTFAWYALIAWGIPAVITICMAIVNYLPGDHLKPGIGNDSCWFETEHAWYLWFYSILAILISINVLIFIYITFFFCHNNFSSSHAATLKYRFGLALKLFFVMGLYWIIELVAGSVSENNVFWDILNIISGLQGLWIFLAWVVFRKRVVKALYQRGWLVCISRPVEKYLANDDEAGDYFVERLSDDPMSER